MNDAKTMGSLASRLLGFVNTTPVHDSNYDIAVAMLQNYDRMKEMSIGDIADLCFVSKASISRFCRFLGFEGFKEFHSYLQQDFAMNSDYSRQFLAMLSTDKEMALSTYRDELITNIYATVSPENMEIMPDIVRTMHECKHIAYFSHHFLWDIGRHFQNKMMIMGRYVEQFLDYTAQLECARRLDKNSLAIVCSVGGSYPSRYPLLWNEISSSGCKLLVITQNMSSPNWNTASYILRCGQSNRNDIGKYSALMVTDLILINYMRRYDKGVF